MRTIVASFLLIAGTAGLTLPDFAFALDSVSGSDALPASLAVSEVEAGRYLVSGVPEYPASSMRVLSWSVGGVTGSRYLPQPVGKPLFLHFPIRTIGAVSGLVPELWRNGARQSSAENDLVLTETTLGDARVTGLPSGHGEWLLVVPWLGGNLVAGWSGSTAETELVAETIERLLLTKRLRTDWTLTPVSIPGVSFDPEVAAHVSPWTPVQVREETGYVELSLHQVDAFQNDSTSGIATLASGTTAEVASVYTLTRARFTLRVPGQANQREQLLESYGERIKALFLGLRVVHDGPPKIILRQLPNTPPRTWRDTDDGDWRRRDLDVLIRRWERREHAGVQEVSI